MSPLLGSLPRFQGCMLSWQSLFWRSRHWPNCRGQLLFLWALMVLHHVTHHFDGAGGWMVDLCSPQHAGYAQWSHTGCPQHLLGLLISFRLARTQCLQPTAVLFWAYWYAFICLPQSTDSHFLHQSSEVFSSLECSLMDSTETLKGSSFVSCELPRTLLTNTVPGTVADEVLTLLDFSCYTSSLLGLLTFATSLVQARRGYSCKRYAIHACCFCQ